MILGRKSWFLEWLFTTFSSEVFVKPLKYAGDAKDENTADDVEEITESKDAHEMVEIILFSEEPNGGEDVANNSKDSHKNL